MGRDICWLETLAIGFVAHLLEAEVFRHWVHVIMVTVFSSAAANLEQQPATSTKPFYVTTPIFYSNVSPHIGHLHPRRW